MDVPVIIPKLDPDIFQAKTPAAAAKAAAIGGDLRNAYAAMTRSALSDVMINATIDIATGSVAYFLPTDALNSYIVPSPSPTPTPDPNTRQRALAGGMMVGAPTSLTVFSTAVGRGLQTTGSRVVLRITVNVEGSGSGSDVIAASRLAIANITASLAAANADVSADSPLMALAAAISVTSGVPAADLLPRTDTAGILFWDPPPRFVAVVSGTPPPPATNTSAIATVAIAIVAVIALAGGAWLVRRRARVKAAKVAEISFRAKGAASDEAAGSAEDALRVPTTRENVVFVLADVAAPVRDPGASRTIAGALARASAAVRETALADARWKKRARQAAVLLRERRLLARAGCQDTDSPQPAGSESRSEPEILKTVHADRPAVTVQREGDSARQTAWGELAGVLLSTAPLHSLPLDPRDGPVMLSAGRNHVQRGRRGALELAESPRAVTSQTEAEGGGGGLPGTMTGWDEEAPTPRSPPRDPNTLLEVVVGAPIWLPPVVAAGLEARWEPPAIFTFGRGGGAAAQGGTAWYEAANAFYSAPAGFSRGGSADHASARSSGRTPAILPEETRSRPQSRSEAVALLASPAAPPTLRTHSPNARAGAGTHSPLRRTPGQHRISPVPAARVLNAGTRVARVAAVRVAAVVGHLPAPPKGPPPPKAGLHLPEARGSPQQGLKPPPPTYGEVDTAGSLVHRVRTIIAAGFGAGPAPSAPESLVSRHSRTLSAFTYGTKRDGGGEPVRRRFAWNE